VLSCFPE